MRAALSIAGVLVAIFAGVACGGDDDDDATTPVPAETVSPTPVPADATRTPDTTFAGLRVAFVNLHAPEGPEGEAVDTFDARLDLVIAELHAFEPDVVAVTEASWSETTGRAASRLASELRMEFQYARQQPWPDDEETDPDALVAEAGWESGDLVLSRFPIYAADSHELATGALGDEGVERRIAMHVVVRLPDPVGAVDIYVADLTGGDSLLERQRATELLAFIEETRGEGPVIVAGSFGLTPSALGLEPLLKAGYVDLAAAASDYPLPTCCRERLIDPEETPAARVDFLLSDGWHAQTVTLFAHRPHLQDDGTELYASDRNGLLAVLPVTEEYLPRLQPVP